MTFSATEPPSPEALARAGQLSVFDETGATVPFGSLYADQRTIVLFIRHFYCGICQAYLEHVSANVTPAMLEAAGVKLVVIGCGDAGLVAPYRRRLKFDFPVYADPTKKTYNELGMTLRTLDGGKEDPEYVKESTIQNVMSSIKSAFSFGKLGSNPGDIKQVGGEFVLGPGNEVTYTHRMENTKGHGPLAELLAAAGVKK